MAAFQIKYLSTLSSDLVVQKLNAFMGQEQEMQKFDKTAQWQFNPSTLTGELKGKQFSAKVKVLPEPNESTLVLLDINLALLLTPLKGKIAEILTAKLNKHLS